MVLPPLTAESRADFARNQIIVVPHAVAGEELDHLRAVVDDVVTWPETPGHWMIYSEAEGDRRPARIENLLAYSAPLAGWLAEDPLMAWLEELVGEPLALFKDKLNLKRPGGGAFRAHQDEPAFSMFGHTWHLTVGLAVDEATVENGCLEFVDGPSPTGVLRSAPDGTLHPEVEAGLAWRHLPMPAGALVAFGSFLPHRSAPNRSHADRRLLLTTYNLAREGDRRSDYLQAKRQAFPPDVERVPGVDYTATPSPFNLGNPIK
jgi:hypothetical protein